MLGILLQCENLDFYLRRMDPATAAIERCSLPKDVADEESRRPFGVITWLVQIWSLM